eukprot:TRINITY_DN4048_c0_g1_i3.p1 TRINITY_DN4048_c0_g1~~TRINITY_DN4048_c0_g1_i3.p1  ORF type:complete len:752 (+),score=151.31 TRINITY_DN4048_c0_g1_i3:131-2386(+)
MGCCHGRRQASPLQDDESDELVRSLSTESCTSVPSSFVNEAEKKEFFMRKVPLMKILPQPKLHELAERVYYEDYPANAIVVKQGDVGDGMYLITSGQAAVLIRKNADEANVKVATLRSGDFFGELSLINHAPRAATVVAESDEGLQALVITKEVFAELDLASELDFSGRKAVKHRGKQKDVKDKPSRENKSALDKMFITQAISSNVNLSSVLDASLFPGLVDAAWIERRNSGEDLMVQGDIDAEFFYVVKTGSFDVLIDNQVVGHVKEGQSVGELALLFDAPRAATIKATEAAELWTVDRQTFKDLLVESNSAKAKHIVPYLNHVALIDVLLQAEKLQLAKAVTEVHYDKGTKLLAQQEEQKTVFVLLTGKVEVTASNGEKELEWAEVDNDGLIKYVPTFGSIALIGDHHRSSLDVEVISDDGATCLTLDRLGFQMVLGHLGDILIQSQAGKDYDGSHSAQVDEDVVVTAPILMKSLTKVALLGAGNFGNVELMEESSTGEVYAMKTISKGFIVKERLQDAIINEKSVMFMLHNDFITRLYETYSTQESVHFLMEVSLGGELYGAYHKNGLYGNVNCAKFYAAGVTLAFAHMHSKKVAYRDLKPENILLNTFGYSKIVDFGLSKIVLGKTFTTCGTPEYFAPEIITSSGHNQSADWWALGIFIFECLGSAPPFEGTSPMQIFGKVLQGIERVTFPYRIGPEAKELIVSLLKTEPGHRLPMKAGGADNIKNASWYQGLLTRHSDLKSRTNRT